MMEPSIAGSQVLFYSAVAAVSFKMPLLHLSSDKKARVPVAFIDKSNNNCGKDKITCTDVEEREREGGERRER